MRAFRYLAIGYMIFFCGCASRTRLRADYVRATLPYESAVLLKSAEKIRRDDPAVSSRTMAPLDQLIIEDALRLHICLSDPHIPEKDKSYGRNVLPSVVTYIATNHVGAGFKSGVDYDMLPNDSIFPPQMKIRDVLDELILDQQTR
jgi:hypothetical protein